MTDNLDKYQTKSAAHFELHSFVLITDYQSSIRASFTVK